MAATWFIVGQSPLVSLAELVSIYSKAEKPQYFEGPRAVRFANLEPVANLAHLGGSVKTGKELWTDLSLEQIPTVASEYLDRTLNGKITFGVSVYSADLATGVALAEDLGHEIKAAVNERERSARFVDSRGMAQLNAASVVYNKLLGEKGIEFLVIETHPGKYTIASTTAVQPFQELSDRDFGRPGRDDKSGMLPPKLALMMINLAGVKKDLTLLDPFCGSGTIVTEALLAGYQTIIGSDLSERAVADTKRNVAWTNKEKQIAVEPQIFASSAETLFEKLSPASVDAIVAEPYMGPPLRGSESVEQVKKTANELAQLYTQAFISFGKILKSGAPVIFIVPRFFVGGSWQTISDKIIPELKKLGFEKTRLIDEAISPPTYILYHRAGQKVGREIWKFCFKKPSL